MFASQGFEHRRSKAERERERVRGEESEDVCRKGRDGLDWGDEKQQRVKEEDPDIR